MRSSRLALSMFILLSSACMGVESGKADAIAEIVPEHTAPQGQELFAGNHDLYDAAGRLVTLHGLNWGGFDDGHTMVSGLTGGPGLTADFATVVLRQKLLGFNAVRLPFSFSDLCDLPPKAFIQLCSMPTDAQVAQSALPPGASLPGRIPSLSRPPHRIAGQCNGYLPNDTTWNRFKWVVSFYARNGFYVVINNRLSADRLALDNPERWATLWARLVKELREDATVRRHLMVDLLDEPDVAGLRWETQASLPALGDLYLRAMSTIERASPGSLYFIEGAGQDGLPAAWGDGFCTDNEIIAERGLSNPRPFFARLQRKPYARRVVIAPHVHTRPPPIESVRGEPLNLSQRLTASFGSLTQHGYCPDGAKTSPSSTSFPVALGEFGADLSDDSNVSTLINYLRAEGEGNDGLHAPIRNWFWGAWNSSGEDAGALVADNWAAIEWCQIDILRRLGLRQSWLGN